MSKTLKLSGSLSKDVNALCKIYKVKDDVKSIKKFCELITKSAERDATITLQSLYETYCNFCKDNEMKPQGKNVLSAFIDAKFGDKCALTGNATGFRFIKYSDDAELYTEL